MAGVPLRDEVTEDRVRICAEFLDPSMFSISHSEDNC